MVNQQKVPSSSPVRPASADYEHMTGVSTEVMPQTRWCVHDGDSTEPPVCEHLHTATGEHLPFHRWYLGTGMDCELLCPICVERRAKGEEVAIRSICNECTDGVVKVWGEEQPHIGDPEVRNRPQPVDARLVATELAVDDIHDVAIARDISNTTFVLTPDGQIIRLNHVDNSAVSCGAVSLDPAAKAQGSGHQPVRRPRLHISPDGNFAAVVSDFGQSGSVIDLQNRRLTMRLDGDQNHIDSVPFSLAFSQYRGETVLVHRTSWNRLDVSNPADGSLLTERTVPPFGEGSDDHKRLDYFHGALFLSPDGTKLLNDGWNWEPVGRPVVWSLLEWIRGNAWESESGRSRLTIPHQNHYWNQGFCWIDNRHIAVEGIGHPDDEMISGVRIFDVTPNPDSEFAREVDVFAGPAGSLFADGDHLFSADAQGLGIWSISEGALTGRISGFTPTVHSALDRTLIDTKGGSVRRWSY